MIRFLLTSWWVYVPIVAVLIYLTRRNNQKIKQIKSQHSAAAHPAHTPQSTQVDHPVAHTTHKEPNKSARAAGKLGLSGAIKYIHHK